jgi:hypothetical protein
MGLASTGPHDATPTPSPFPWNSTVLLLPCPPNSALFLLRFSSLTRGGNSFPASGVFGPHPISHPCPIMSHVPVRSLFWWFVPSISTALRAPSAASACGRPVPPNPRTTSQIFSCSLPALDLEPDPSYSLVLPLPRLGLSYPLLSHPRPCRSSREMRDGGIWARSTCSKYRCDPLLPISRTLSSAASTLDTTQCSKTAGSSQYSVSLRSDISLHSTETRTPAPQASWAQASRQASKQGCPNALMAISPISPPNRAG